MNREGVGWKFLFVLSAFTDVLTQWKVVASYHCPVSTFCLGNQNFNHLIQIFEVQGKSLGCRIRFINIREEDGEF
jgi:hypothetical protein